MHACMARLGSAHLEQRLEARRHVLHALAVPTRAVRPARRRVLLPRRAVGLAV